MKNQNKLKIKNIKISAGRPISFLNRNKALSLNLNTGDRISVVFKNKKIVNILDLTDSFINEDEIVLSQESLLYLDAKRGDFVKLEQVSNPKSLPCIMKKMNGHHLGKKEINLIINDIVSNTLTEAEVAYFVSAVYEKGMSLEETIFLTEAIFKTGENLSWPQKNVADKHCIGGVPGNRTTPIVISICAAAGVIMPKTSSRAITSAAGTADVMETLTKVDLSLSELKKVVKKTNACLAWGGSLGLAPADDKLIRVERLLGVDPEAQLLSSIMAKKIAAGSKNILIDIPCGNGAKVSKKEAENLSEKFKKIGNHFNLKIKTILTDGSEPIGNGIGPNLEMKDVLAVLERRNSPEDLEKKSVFLAGIILEMLGKVKKGKGEEFALEILNSGSARQKFNEIINAQGKKKSLLPIGKYNKTIFSEKTGKIISINNNLINSIARILGCPVDNASGIYLYKHKNDRIFIREKICTLYAESESKLNDALSFIKSSFPFNIS